MSSPDEAPGEPKADAVDVVFDAAQSANTAINGLADTVGVTPLVNDNPYGMVAAALGVGYVLGGGLLSPTTARVVQLGLKIAAIPAVQNQLLSAAEGFIDGLLTQGRRAGLDSPPK